MVVEEAAEFRSALLTWAEENVRELPWREPDRSFYDVFVAEFFLTQTPAENVATVYPRFLERFPSLEAIDAASREELVALIEPLGFYNLRADALRSIAADRDLLPKTAEGLAELERVGPYVANATVCLAKDEPVPLLDRNVDRIYRRIFGDTWPEREADQIRFAERVLPETDVRRYNLALLDFAAAICQPEPRCEECFATEYCAYYRENVA